MKVKLNEKLSALNSREDFVDFIQSLRQDYEQAPEEWENRSLPDYLEALAAWTGSMYNYYKNNKLPNPPEENWRVFAEILLAAKYYE